MAPSFRISVRTILFLGIGLGLTALALWSSSALPALGASSSPLASIPQVVPLAPSASPVSIPLTSEVVTLDGYCDPTEYPYAVVQDYSDYGGFKGAISLQHDSTYLYVCMQGLGSDNMRQDRFASVYLDPNNSADPFANKDDYALRVSIITGTLTSAVGTGSGNYTPAEITGWSAMASYDPKYDLDTAEYQIPLTLTGGRCGVNFRMAVYHHWLYGGGDDYGWPSNTYYDSPQTWQEVNLITPPCMSGNIAYVYSYDVTIAVDFENFLEGQGFTVQLVPLSDVLITDFSLFDLVIVANDTGELDKWGTEFGQADQIVVGGKSVLGLGEGGYAFFGMLGRRIGWPNGWHGPFDRVIAADVSLSYYLNPYDLSALLPGPFPIYTEPVNEVGIYLPAPVSGVLPIGWEPFGGQAPDHASLVAEDCHQLWGFSAGPQTMNSDGLDLFVNAVVFGMQQQCTPPPPPPVDCLTLTKTTSPLTAVSPGDVIKYTLAYAVTNDQACHITQATLVDPIPDGTLYIPNSAGDGISPTIEGVLKWDLGNLVPGASGSKSFKVTVLDSACHGQSKIVNGAQIYSSLGVEDSNPYSHDLNCPPVTFPNDQPPYAETEVQVYPYPLIAGHPSTFSARIENLSASPQTITVTFQHSPGRFGIGLAFDAIPVPGNPRVMTIPPGGTAEASIIWAPEVPGHYCIQVKVEGAGFAAIYTQRNLDVAENLQPGVEDTITFSVGNPTGSTADIILVVDNTCPGWTAWVDPATILGLNPGAVSTATLYVIPPSTGILLGTACHIDVQGWIGDHLIGGIRKLDVPAVQLPHSEPPWMEPEISVNPDPPVVGQPTQFCVDLQNPISTPRQVTIIYSAADFGAGIPFTQINTRTVTLPGNSSNRYCISWTPAAGGTLHRCLQIQLQQAGFRDQFSQRNIDIVRGIPTAGTVLTFRVGNTQAFTQTLEIRTDLVGIWGFIPVLDPSVPPELGPDEIITVTLELTTSSAAASFADPYAAIGSTFGDSHQVEVSVYLSGNLIGGFTVEYIPLNKVYLPLLKR